MSFASLAGKRLVSVRLVAGNTGPWFAECELEGDAQVSGQVTLEINGTPFAGTVDESSNGVFDGNRKVRVLAGGGGWARNVTARNYHNDARIRARTVVEDAARAVGETIGGFVPIAERIGIDYVREAGPASRVLEDVIGGVPWWVDYDGVTRVGMRSSVEAASDAYDVLAYDPMDRRATLGVVDVSAIQVGSIISKTLEAPQTVRELEIVADAEELRVTVWCGGSATGAGQLAQLMLSIVKRTSDGRIWGKYRYRVVRMSTDRVELQAVRQAAGLPDVMPVSMWPGVAGAHAELAPGAEVLVEFIEGDRTMPVITHFAGKDGVGHVPVSLTLCGSEQAAARQGDLVQSGGPGTVAFFLPVTGPNPPALLPGVPYLVSFSTNLLAVGPLQAPLYGAISTGSPKVKA